MRRRSRSSTVLSLCPVTVFISGRVATAATSAQSWKPQRWHYLNPLRTSESNCMTIHQDVPLGKCQPAGDRGWWKIRVPFQPMGLSRRATNHHRYHLVSKMTKLYWATENTSGACLLCFIVFSVWKMQSANECCFSSWSWASQHCNTAVADFISL